MSQATTGDISRNRIRVRGLKVRQRCVCRPRYAACTSYSGMGPVPPVNSANAGSSECNWLPPGFQELLRGAGASGSACTWRPPSGLEQETTRNIVEVATDLKAGGVAYLGFRSRVGH